MNYLYVLIVELIAFSSLAFAEAEIEGKYGGGGEHAKVLRCGPVRVRKYHLFFQGISIPLFLSIVLVAAGIDLGLIFILCIGYFLGGLLQDFIWFLINPHYGIKRFNRKDAYWLKWWKIWKIDLPYFYYTNPFIALILSLIFLNTG